MKATYDYSKVIARTTAMVRDDAVQGLAQRRFMEFDRCHRFCRVHLLPRECVLGKLLTLFSF